MSPPTLLPPTSHTPPPGNPPPSYGHGYGPPPAPPAPLTGWALEVKEGQLMALISWASMFCGLPLFLIPMIQKDNRFALFHAKQAAVNFGVFFIVGLTVFAIAFATCGLGALLAPLALLPWITTVHGIMLAVNGEAQEPMLNFGLGERLFYGVQPEPNPRYAEPAHRAQQQAQAEHHSTTAGR